jgi:maltose alpha-D-glucosyltransferase/alpha-amylase
MLDGDRRRLELAFSLLLTLPGTPVLYYGDEIGMGEDLSLRERESVRTPMQWSASRNGGFSTARRADLCAPVVTTGRFGYRSTNVSDQQGEPQSLLTWMQHAIRARSQIPECGKGAWEPMETGDGSVLALRFLDGKQAVVAVHNFAGEPRTATLRGLDRSAEVFANRRYDSPERGTVELDAYGYRWLRGFITN